MDDPFALLIVVQTHRYDRDAEGVCVRLSNYGALDPEYSVQMVMCCGKAEKGTIPGTSGWESPSVIELVTSNLNVGCINIC